MVDDQEAWKSFAACTPIDNDLFFDEQRTALAKQFCRTNCAVRYDCLEYAYRTASDFGVFGGFDEIERQRMKKRYGMKGIALLIERQRLTSS